MKIVKLKDIDAVVSVSYNIYSSVSFYNVKIETVYGCPLFYCDCQTCIEHAKSRA